MFAYGNFRLLYFHIGHIGYGSAIESSAVECSFAGKLGPIP